MAKKCRMAGDGHSRRTRPSNTTGEPGSDRHDLNFLFEAEELKKKKKEIQIEKPSGNRRRSTSLPLSKSKRTKKSKTAKLTASEGQTVKKFRVCADSEGSDIETAHQEVTTNKNSQRSSSTRRGRPKSHIPRDLQPATALFYSPSPSSASTISEETSDQDCLVNAWLSSRFCSCPSRASSETSETSCSSSSRLDCRDDPSFPRPSTSGKNSSKLKRRRSHYSHHLQPKRDKTRRSKAGTSKSKSRKNVSSRGCVRQPKGGKRGRSKTK